jgi:hypothetical protein
MSSGGRRVVTRPADPRESFEPASQKTSSAQRSPLPHRSPDHAVRFDQSAGACVCVDAITIGGPPNHAFVSPSPTYSAARCEPPCSTSQMGSPL